MISANGGLPAHRYTPQVTQRWPRGSEPASGNDEREQTLNQLLTEMDGFEGNTGVETMRAGWSRVDCFGVWVVNFVSPIKSQTSHVM